MFGLQLLQKENAQITSKLKELLQELDSQKEQNKVLLDEVARLTTSLNDIKVPKFWFLWKLSIIFLNSHTS